MQYLFNADMLVTGQTFHERRNTTVAQAIEDWVIREIETDKEMKLLDSVHTDL